MTTQPQLREKVKEIFDKYAYTNDGKPILLYHSVEPDIIDDIVSLLTAAVMEERERCVKILNDNEGAVWVNSSEGYYARLLGLNVEEK